MIVVTLARKPLGGTVSSNVLRHGAGALNIDGSRIGVVGEKIHAPQSDPSKRQGEVGRDLGITRSSIGEMQAAQQASIEKANNLGRWPANVLLQHAAGCVRTGVKTDEVPTFDSSHSDRFIARDADVKIARTGESRSLVTEQWDCTEGCPVRGLDDQTGIRASGVAVRHRSGGRNCHSDAQKPPLPDMGYGDTGSAARYFKQFSRADESPEH